ncbi:MAG: BON domain-containing protein [Humidesulfovibrio sp.]|nr:BON domain-containing protein [Humidesulfovibrio sp.]
MSAQTAFLVFIALVLLVFLVARTRPAAQAGDRAITAAIDAALAKEFTFANQQIEVKTFDGVVILGGFTREFEQAKRAVEIARGTPGVKSVDNRIAIRTGH